MSSSALRFFLPEGPATPLPSEPALVRVVDALVVRGRRVVVCRDLGGELVAVDDADVSIDLKPALVHHEIARQRPLRSLDVDGLWLFGVELLEQPGDTPGENDPVRLSGVLTGPFKGVQATTSTPGSLTVSRGDLLRGFGEGAADVFHGDTGAIVHAMLPAADANEIAAGRGVVVAYPLFPVDVPGGNEAAALAVFLDTAKALQDDVKAHRAGHPFANDVLPVASRRAWEAAVEAEGFVVEGDVAVRKSGGFFGSTERRPVPPELRLDDVYATAARCLAALAPAFPDPRSRALFERLRMSSSASMAPPTTTPTPVQQPYRKTPVDWMSDFSSSSAPTPTTKPPRTTTVTTPKKPATSTSQPTATSKAAAKPDWMKDFE